MTKPFLPLSMTPEALIAFTPEWEGERSADGRPRVPDSVIGRMKLVTVTEAWMAMNNREYSFQYEGGWERVNPEISLCGRALTATYMPKRPSLHKTVEEKAYAAGMVGDQVSWPIDHLTQGDIYVADVFGKIERGPVIGDNLSTAILAKSGNGTLQNAAIRDIDGIKEIEGFTAFHRGVHPSYASPTVTIMGINCPVRVGATTIMPGDVLLAKEDGLAVIPPHLAETICTISEIVRVRDIFGKMRLNEGKYLPGQIDGKWAEEIEEDFRGWLAEGDRDLPVPAETIASFLMQQGRTW